MPINALQAQQRSVLSISQVLGAPIVTRTLALTSSSAALTLDVNKTYRLIANVNCYVLVTAGGSTAATSTTAARMIADLPEFFGTWNGYTRIAAIRDTADGTLWVTELD